MRRIRRSRVPSRDSTPDHGVLLEKFTDGRRRPALRRGHRGQIDRRYLLPPLAKLLAIDAAEEQAVAQARIDGGERKRAGTTAETLDGCGPHTGTGGRPPAGPSGDPAVQPAVAPFRDFHRRNGLNPAGGVLRRKKT